MTTPPATPPAAPPADPKTPPDARTVDEKIAAAKDEILTEVRKLVGGARQREGEHLTEPGQGRGERAAAAGQTLEQQIADAIRVNDEARARTEADKAREDRLGKLEAAAAEKPPVDRRRVHRLMGWGDPPQ